MKMMFGVLYLRSASFRVLNMQFSRFVVRFDVVFPFYVVSSFTTRGCLRSLKLPAFLEVTDLICLDVVMAGGRQLLPIVAALKKIKASMKASSSRWRPWLIGWSLLSSMMKTRTIGALRRACIDGSKVC